jgi:PAS domain-containing protein
LPTRFGRELNLQQMTETIPETLWRASPDGAIDYCKARFLEYAGFSAEAVGDGWQHTLHPDDAVRAAPTWMGCEALGDQDRVEARTFHAADRTYRLCAVTALPLCDEQGHILKWHGIIVDMHDWNQIQDELRSTRHRRRSAETRQQYRVGRYRAQFCGAFGVRSR